MSARAYITAALISVVGMVGLYSLRPEPVSADAIAKTYPFGLAFDSDGNEILTATCGSSGTQLTDADTNAQNPAVGLYWTTAAADDVFLCDAATCASPDGVHIPAGMAVAYRVKTAGAYACRSTSGNGVVRLHPAE